MDSLEALERGRDLPPEAYGPPVNPVNSEIIPLRIDPSFAHVLQEFNRSAVFFLDDEIVVKAQQQYHVPSVSLPGDRFLLNLGLANFEGTQLERQVLTMLRSSPHPNLVRCLDVNGDGTADYMEGIMFFERLDPLSPAWANSNPACRRRWAIELASAFSHLELLGLIPSKTYVRDLAIDKNGQLKLTGFGASQRHFDRETRQEDSTGNYNHERIWTNEDTRKCQGSAHQRLASCLHYVLTGVDPDEQARDIGHARHSRKDRIQWREKVRRGEYPVAPGAEPIADILHDAWTLKTVTGPPVTSFAAVEQKIRDALGPLGIGEEWSSQLGNADDVGILEEKCRAWLRFQEREPRWLGLREYEEAVSNAIAGYNP